MKHNEGWIDAGLSRPNRKKTTLYELHTYYPAVSKSFQCACQTYLKERGKKKNKSDITLVTCNKNNCASALACNYLIRQCIKSHRCSSRTLHRRSVGEKCHLWAGSSLCSVTANLLRFGNPH